MTDEEIIKQSLKAVNEYAKGHKGSDFDIEDSVKCAVKAIEPVWRSVRFPEAVTGFGTERDYRPGKTAAGTASQGSCL